MDEFYNFTWYGKTNAVKEADTPTNKKMVACRKESVDFDNTNNLFIEGDNLDALKLLREQYAGKVKMIYIDPPYNTGNKFLYKDNFNLKGKNLSDGDKRHAGWLNMMYPRLKLARELLRDDGVIFISIDVNELKNLKHICDEVFGENNFIEIFSWVKTATPSTLSKKSRKTNEYILCYEKNRNSIRYNGGLLDGSDHSLLNRGNKEKLLKFPKSVVKFTYTTNTVIKKGKHHRVFLPEDIEIRNGFAISDFCLKGEFKWSQEFLDKEIKEGTIFLVKSDKMAVRHLRATIGYKPPNNFFKDKILGPTLDKPSKGIATNEKAKKELIQLFKSHFFDYPKPISLLRYLVNFISTGDDIILDFFAGSATTAHAVMQRNVEENHHCQFIMVQLPEVCDEKTEAAKAGYSTIAELSKERIRRAAKQIKEEHPKTEADLGFKVFKLID